MTGNEQLALGILQSLVEEVSRTNNEAHKDIILRIDTMERRLCDKFGKSIDDIHTHCAIREKVVNEAIEKATQRVSPFELSVKTIAKFGAGLIVYTGIVAGIVTGLIKAIV